MNNAMFSLSLSLLERDKEDKEREKKKGKGSPSQKKTPWRDTCPSREFCLISSCEGCGER